MKTLLKLRFALFIAAISFGLFSCEKEDIQENFTETWKFNEEVFITDANGEHETSLLISSNEDNWIEDFLSMNTLELELIYDIPEQPIVSKKSSIEPLDASGKTTEAGNHFFTDGPANNPAPGFGIIITPNVSSKSVNAGTTINYTSSKDKVWVETANMGPGSIVPVEYKLKSKRYAVSAYFTKHTGSIDSPGDVSYILHHNGSFRTRARCTHNYSGSMLFYKVCFAN